MADIETLAVYDAETTPTITSNIDELAAQCQALADQYAARDIQTKDDYRAAKADRADLNRAIKQIDEVTRQTRRQWMEPLLDFEARVDDARSPLMDAVTDVAGSIKDYERKILSEKRERLESYWEEHYPLLALCTGEAEEPLVPFSRVYDPDWCKRVSEADDDRKPREAMDDVAESLAQGAEMIRGLNETDEVKSDAMSRMYRTLDAVKAVSQAREEARRKADIQQMEDWQRDAGYLDEGPAVGDAPAVYEVTITCVGEAEKARVIAALKAANIHGTVRRTA